MPWQYAEGRMVAGNHRDSVRRLVQKEVGVRSRLDGPRYRRRMVVLIIVATGMVCVKLVAMSWKGGSTPGKTNSVGQTTSAPVTRRAH